jgi:orotate phosphoribosyltransferase
LREAGYQPVAALTVVDREQGGEALIRQKGTRFLRLATLLEIQQSGG